MCFLSPLEVDFQVSFFFFSFQGLPWTEARLDLSVRFRFPMRESRSKSTLIDKVETMIAHVHSHQMPNVTSVKPVRGREVP